jgi:phenylpyruvate tautomerase PptA (4-oxalocrotonate tautomerase family)
MPTLIIKTNADPSRHSQEALLTTASSTVAELLGKPEGYVMVLLEPVPAMCFGGDTAPCAYLELKSLGLPEPRTPELSAALCGLVEAHLGVPKSRVYIEFASPPRHLFGYDGRTFG